MVTIEEKARDWAKTYPRLKDHEYTNDDVTAMIEDSYLQGASDQQRIDYKKLVHRPDNEKGITSAELAHQLYGAKYQEKIDLEKAIRVYTKELKEIMAIFNRLGKELYDINELGELIHLEGCVKDFRKAMQE